jgi:hypothetical protein
MNKFSIYIYYDLKKFCSSNQKSFEIITHFAVQFSYLFHQS